MATWKKVFTSDDTIPLSSGGTGANLNSAGAIVSDGSNLSSATLTDGQLVIGATGSTPAAQSVSGVMTLSKTGVTALVDDSVTGNIIANHGVGLGKLVAGTQGDLIAYNGSGDAAVFGIGSDGQVLTVDDDATNGLKLAWVDAPAAANNVIAALQTSRDPLITSNGTGNSQTLHGTVATLSYDSDESFVHSTIAELDAGAQSTFDGDNSRGGLFSANGFNGNLAGIASGAVNVDTTALSSGTAYLGVYASNSAGYQVPSTQSILSVNLNSGQEALTIAGDLIVSGTTTTVSSTDVTVADATLKLASGVSGSSTVQAAGSAAAAGGVGIVVGNGTATEDKLARFVYEGHADTASVLGWNIAQENEDAAADLTANTAYGVGVMHVQSTTFAEVADDDDALNIGVGAMLYSSHGTGGLFIQTA